MNRVYPLDAVMPFIGIGMKKSFKDDAGKCRVNLNHYHYRVFKQSLKCACCGVEGLFFNLERTSDCGYGVLVPYGIDSFGFVPITVDHIVPIAKGGTNDMDNLQTLCRRCNNLKTDSIISLEELQILRKKKL